MKTIELFWSFRSPYSFFATKRLRALPSKWKINLRPRPVYPLAIRDNDFFAQIRPQWIPYLMRDIFRVAQSEGLEFGPPSPDPVVMDMATRKVSDEQPYIHRLTRLGILAAERGNEEGMAFLDELSSVIWSGKPWQGDVLVEAAARAGFNLADMDKQQESETARLEAIIAENQAEQLKHHWGVPLMVYEGEAFFGQDRIALLEWRLEQDGVERV